MSKSISTADLESHKTAESGGIWIAIEGDVYDVTNFVDEHPGGAKILKRVGGKDATKQFWKYHNEGILKKYKPKLQIGTLAEKAKL